MALKANLITGRTIDQGANLENKTAPAYLEATACCELNSNDIDQLGGTTVSRVKVRTQYGEVVVNLKENNGNPDGIAFIPMGPWANAVVDPDTKGCGMPGFKGIETEIEMTDDRVLVMKELMEGYK